MTGGRAVRVAVIDYGAGNLVSIGNALVAVGAETRVARAAADLEGVDALVIPGVGASAPAMGRLRRQGLIGPIRRAVDGGAWLVGICLGMQLLFERSDEDDARMLGLLGGDVVRIADAPRLPHIGWNTLELLGAHPITAGVADGSPAYFVHSFVPRPTDPRVVVAETEHGSRFPSIVAAERLIGFQFHPERSGADGLRLLANTIALVAGRDPAGGIAPRLRLVEAGY